MKVSTRLQRSSMLAAGLVLLAGASGLFGQTVQNPEFSVPTTNLLFARDATVQSTPRAQSIRIYSTPAAVNYTALVTYPAGETTGWLFLTCGTCGGATNVTQLSGNTGTEGELLTISVSPSLPVRATPYTGVVNLISGTKVVPITVTYNVTAGPHLVITPASIGLVTIERTQSAPTLIENVTIASTGTQQFFVTTVDVMTPNTGWLVVNPSTGGITGVTPVQVFVDTSKIPAGVDRVSAGLRFGITGGAAVTMPLTVKIGASSALQVAPTSARFLYQPGPTGTAPSPRQISVTNSTGTPVGYRVEVGAGSPYFKLSTSGSANPALALTGLTTPNGFFIVPDISAIGTPAVGTVFEAPIIVTPVNGAPQTITARIEVTNQNLLVTDREAVNFTYTLGGVDFAGQTISVTSTGVPQTFFASAIFDTANPVQFFRADALGTVTPAGVNVVPNMEIIRTLGAGTYNGTVRLTPSVGDKIQDIPVRLTISIFGQLGVDNYAPTAFEGALGLPVTPVNQRIVVTNTNPAIPHTFSVQCDNGNGVPTTCGQGAGAWLLADRQSGNTAFAESSAILISVAPSAVTAAGTYRATLVITPTDVADAVPVRVNVQYKVNATQSVTADPARLDLTQVGNVPPAAQTVQIRTTSISTLLFSPNVTAPTSDPIFVSVPAGSFSVPGALQLTFTGAATLTPRAEPYRNDVVLNSFSGQAPVTIPVFLRVTSPSTLQATPTSLSFAFTTGGANPASQTINLTATGAAIPFSVAATSQFTWLTVTPPSGTTNAAGGAAVPVSVSVNPAGLTAGTYNGTVSITPTTPGSNPVAVNVSFVVTNPNPPNGLQVSNNASGLSRGVSPGQFITIKGRNMAPATGVVFTTVPVPTTLGDVRVLFDNVPAPVLYVGPAGDRNGDQINAIVPYGIGGRATTNMTVEYKGVTSQSIPLTVREADPGIYTVNQAGTGAASLLNQNNSANAQNNPAVAGSIIQIYATGEGGFSPNPGDGRVVPATLPFPTLLVGPVQVRINGRVARVEYAGPSPGLVAGVLQINAVVPADLAVTGTTTATLEIQLGNTTSQSGVTFWVRGAQ